MLKSSPSSLASQSTTLAEATLFYAEPLGVYHIVEIGAGGSSPSD
jgi:hypothetical protein